MTTDGYYEHASCAWTRTATLRSGTSRATLVREHDADTGEALMLRASAGMQSLYVYDSAGHPAALVTSTAYQDVCKEVISQ